ncbi:DDHD domain-containing protein [Glomus cerebriforme]|uniref:DDHD domain-containing protein n=1 Tax=Glomus cerebriforme TaxID=658196 RepID=A0A397SUP0_9GLOM|nr:DDHD domain-containing protein [Glomus cerebriforme]
MSSPNYPEITAHWFHATDVPLRDPNKKTPITTSSVTTTSSSSLTCSNKLYPSKQPTVWVPFSKRDSNALEASFKSGDSESKILCNEDYLFEVDIQNREISPVYWLGATYEVIRATWFYISDGKFLPCNENLAAQIEDGYKKHKAWIPVPESESTEQTEHVQEKLFGKYLSQYVVYTNPTTAWLLSDDMTGKLTKTVFAKLTNGVHLGGTKLIRGYNEVKKITSKKSSEDETKYKNEFDNLVSNTKSPTSGINQREIKEVVESEDYDDEECEEERVIDHLILVIHGIGQKLSERMEYISFVHDVNTLRKTVKRAYSTSEPVVKNTKSKSDTSTDRRGSNTSDKNVQNSHKFGSGIQVLPIQWRQEIKFGMASEDENVQRDLGMPEAEEGQTTLDEITLEGVPTLRMLISDVLMDVLLYMTPKYREMMINTVTKEMNRVYNLFIERNPKFVEIGGKVSVYGHSLGSVLAFDILCHQPPVIPSTPSGIFEGKGADMHIVKLDFEVRNFFAAGSPIGLFLLLKGLKIASREDRPKINFNQNFSQTLASAAMELGVNMGLPLNNSIIPLCYPAVKNIYNIFHNADPIAYRLEPLIARHYGSSLKPALIPYHKGGLKGMHLGIQEFGNEIASKATNIFSTVKTSLMFSKGLGFQSIIPQSNTITNNSSLKRSTSVPNNSASGENSENNDDVATTNFASAPNLLEKSNKSNENEENKDQHGAARIKSLNSSGRVDWVLQEGLLDVSYINAITVHLSYWSDCDAVNFVIKEIYRDND